MLFLKCFYVFLYLIMFGIPLNFVLWRNSLQFLNNSVVVTIDSDPLMTFFSYFPFLNSNNEYLLFFLFIYFLIIYLFLLFSFFYFYKAFLFVFISIFASFLLAIFFIYPSADIIFEIPNVLSIQKKLSLNEKIELFFTLKNLLKISFDINFISEILPLVENVNDKDKLLLIYFEYFQNILNNQEIKVGTWTRFYNDYYYYIWGTICVFGVFFVLVTMANVDTLYGQDDILLDNVNNTNVALSNISLRVDNLNEKLNVLDWKVNQLFDNVTLANNFKSLLFQVDVLSGVNKELIKLMCISVRDLNYNEDVASIVDSILLLLCQKSPSTAELQALCQELCNILA